VKDKSDFGWEDQEPILLDDPDEVAKSEYSINCFKYVLTN